MEGLDTEVYHPDLPRGRSEEFRAGEGQEAKGDGGGLCLALSEGQKVSLE